MCPLQKEDNKGSEHLNTLNIYKFEQLLWQLPLGHTGLALSIRSLRKKPFNQWTNILTESHVFYIIGTQIDIFFLVSFFVLNNL